MDKLYVNHRFRMMNDFLKNPNNFQNYEVLELLLMFTIPQKDVKPIAKFLINQYGSLNNIFNSNSDLLINVYGLGYKSIVFFQCIKKITELLLLENINPKDSLSMTIEKIASYSHFILGHLTYEQVLVFIFDSKKRLIKEYIHSKGTLSYSPMYLRELLLEILSTKGSFFVLVHNHPSGNPHPSQEDILITKKIYQLFLNVDICLYDHIIISGNNYVSLKKLGLF
jgi:DNA repair protein RadC